MIAVCVRFEIGRSREYNQNKQFTSSLILFTRIRIQYLCFAYENLWTLPKTQAARPDKKCFRFTAFNTVKPRLKYHKCATQIAKSKDNIYMTNNGPAGNLEPVSNKQQLNKKQVNNMFLKIIVMRIYSFYFE